MQTTSTIAQIKGMSPEELIERAKYLLTQMIPDDLMCDATPEMIKADLDDIREYNLIRKEYEAQTNQPLPL